MLSKFGGVLVIKVKYFIILCVSTVQSSTAEFKNISGVCTLKHRFMYFNSLLLNTKIEEFYSFYSFEQGGNRFVKEGYMEYKKLFLWGLE